MDYTFLKKDFDKSYVREILFLALFPRLRVIVKYFQNHRLGDNLVIAISNHADYRSVS